MSNKNESVKKLLGNRIFISLLVLAVGIVTFSAIRNRASETAMREYKPPEKAEEIQVSALLEKEEEKPVAVQAEMPEEEEKIIPIVYKLPLQGELQKGFSANELVWDETMEDWRTHMGIDIASEAGDEVDTAAPGVVVFSGEDSMCGFVVKIDHGDGVMTVYKNLAKTVVSQGDSLDEGQMVGTVGDSAPFEMSQKAHLHFEVIKDGKYVEPMEIIK